MKALTTLEDLVGIEHCKLGFYQELQQKVEQLKTSNQELEKKRREIQAVLDGITDLMVVLSEDLRIQQVNHVFTEWFPGINPIGRTCHEVFRGSGSRCDDCPALRSLDLGQIVKDLCIYKVNNKFRHFEIIASPLKLSPEGERSVLVFKRDVTMEKEFQAQFYQAEKMATIGALAAGVAHEINNPLTAISGFAEGLRRRLGRVRDCVEPEVFADFKEYADTIVKECSRCRDIVQTLLTFSRPVASSPLAGRHEPVRQRHPVPAEASFQGAARHHGQDVAGAGPAEDHGGRIAAEAGHHQPGHQRLRCHRQGRPYRYHHP